MVYRAIGPLLTYVPLAVPISIQVSDALTLCLIPSSTSSVRNPQRPALFSPACLEQDLSCPFHKGVFLRERTCCLAFPKTIFEPTVLFPHIPLPVGLLPYLSSCRFLPVTFSPLKVLYPPPPPPTKQLVSKQPRVGQKLVVMHKPSAWTHLLT